jgi:bacteriochlorophyllide a dehydrogenase
MGYPLVPGYESVGRAWWAGVNRGARRRARLRPGARCFGEVRGLFGGAARRLVVPGRSAVPIGDRARRARRAARAGRDRLARDRGAGAAPPDLIVGHGVLGRLLARLAIALRPGRPAGGVGDQPARLDGARGYEVIHPDDDPSRLPGDLRRERRCRHARHALMQRLAPGGEIVLAGFYSDRLSFAFPPAFMREARLRVAAEWREPISPRARTREQRTPVARWPDHASRGATGAPAGLPHRLHRSACLKMILDWRDVRMSPWPDAPRRASMADDRLRAEAAQEPDARAHRRAAKRRRSSRSTARAASARASRWPTSAT